MLQRWYVPASRCWIPESFNWFWALCSLVLVLTSQSFGASVFNSVVECSLFKYCFNSIDSVEVTRDCPGNEVLLSSVRRMLIYCAIASHSSCLLSSTSEERGTSGCSSLCAKPCYSTLFVATLLETVLAITNFVLHCDEPSGSGSCSFNENWPVGSALHWKEWGARYANRGPQNY